MKLINKVYSFSGVLLKKSPFLLNRLINYRPESLRIVYYHIVSKRKYPFYFSNRAISSDEFIEQLKFFKNHFDIISLSQGIKFANEGKSLKRKLVITFDDGFKDNYTIAAPILRDLNCTATFYLIGDCIDNDNLMWRNKLLLISKTNDTLLNKGLERIVRQYKLSIRNFNNLMQWSSKAIPMNKKEVIVNDLWNHTMNFSIEEFLEKHEPYMTGQQIVELYDDGFEFGSHSMSHPNFRMLTYEEFRNEIINSKELIEQLIQGKIATFAYPFGQRPDLPFEQQLQKENPDAITVFLGTRNRLKNTPNNLISWERDNMEHPFEFALSRFLLVPAIRSFK